MNSENQYDFSYFLTWEFEINLVEFQKLIDFIKEYL